MALPAAAHAQVGLASGAYGNEFVLMSRDWGDIVQTYVSSSSHKGLVGRGWCAGLHVAQGGTHSHIDLETRLEFEGTVVRLVECAGHGEEEGIEEFKLRAAPAGVPRSLLDTARALPPGSSIELTGPEANLSATLTREAFTVHRGNNRALDATYDLAGRLVHLNKVAIAWDKDGRLESLGTPEHTVEARIDENGHLKELVERSVNVGVDFLYDGADHQTGVRNAWQRPLRFRYDDQGRLTFLQFWDDTVSAVFYRPQGTVGAVVLRDHCFRTFRRAPGQDEREARIFMRTVCEDGRHDLEATLWADANGRVERAEVVELTASGQKSRPDFPWRAIVHAY